MTAPFARGVGARGELPASALGSSVPNVDRHLLSLVVVSLIPLAAEFYGSRRAATSKGAHG